MANFYIISFDSDRVDTAALHKLIKNDSDIITWWHYIKSMYLIKTKDNLDGTHKYLLDNWPNNRFLIIKVNPEYRNGWLPPDAWDWFKTNVD